MITKNGKKFKIGLALGGGAALGFAHIGVLKVLEENGIKIDCIAGTSMGSVIGGLYASGMSADKMVETLNSFDIKKITKLNVFSVLKDGIFSTDKMPAYFEQIANVSLVEKTKIPFRCVSVDLYTGKPYIFKKGNFGEAIMASTAIPGLFKPVKKDGMMLVDGGVVNNIPFDVVKDMGADFVIAVDVLPKYVKKQKINSVVKIIICSFELMQNKHELERQKKSDILDYTISISSTNDEQDWSKKAMLEAYQLGVDVASKYVHKIKRLINAKAKQKFLESK